MGVVTKVVHNKSDAPANFATCDYMVCLLTRGVLADTQFAEVLLSFEQARQAEPVDIVTVMADQNFAFPPPEFYTNMEGQGAKGLATATGYRRMLNILALPFSAAASWGIMTTQSTEICRRFRKCKDQRPREASECNHRISWVAEPQVN